MPSIQSLASALLPALSALKKDRRIDIQDLSGLCGKLEGDVRKVLTESSLAREEHGALVASGRLGLGLTAQQTEILERLLLQGGSEAYHGVMEILGAYSFLPEEEKERGPLKGEPDPEAAKRFAKDFIDVSDIANKLELTEQERHAFLGGRLCSE